MRTNILALTLAMVVGGFGFATLAQQKTPAKTAAPTNITVYKTPT